MSTLQFYFGQSVLSHIALNSVQIVWLCCVAAILVALVITAVHVFHLHPLRYIRKHHVIGIEHYDCFFDDDDCDE